MQKMIQDILTFSRVGREQIKLEYVDSNEIARDVFSEFEVLLTKENATINCTHLPVVFTSPTLLRILFQNLLGNALKFQDGRQHPEISIDARLQDDHWCFSFRDNGIGIDPVFQDKIFNIFERFHRKEDYPGTGIGLSTCRKFIRLCGGDIWFASRLSAGTEFFFTLPTYEKHPDVTSIGNIARGG